MGKWALITGASQGIGYEFAKLFAADGYNLVLVARDRSRLMQLADDLQKKYKLTARVLVKDLSVAGAAQEIFNELLEAKIPVSILVNNAGFGFQGAFSKRPLKDHQAMLHVNILALMELTHLFLQPMLNLGEGRILNVASIAAFQPGPFMALYYASKAFVYSFSNALAVEVRGSGVTVTTLSPGVTRSEFHSRAGLKRQGKILTMEASKVAKIGYRALMAGKTKVTTGVFNKVATSVSKALPTAFTAGVAGRMNRKA